MGNFAQTSSHVTCCLPHGGVWSHSGGLSPDDCFMAVRGNTRKFGAQHSQADCPGLLVRISYY